MKRPPRLLVVLLFAAPVALTTEPYRKPPQTVLDVLNAPPTAVLSLSPAGTYAMQATPVRYPSIAELAEPMLRLAGLRINPKTNGLHNSVFNSWLVLRRVPSGVEIRVQLPPNPKLSSAYWSPDGSRFAFTNTTASGIDLWVGETATGRTHKIDGVRINGVMGSPQNGGRPSFGRFAADREPVRWLPDGKGLLVSVVRPNRGAAPVEPAVPVGPTVQESLGGAEPVVTHEDMLQNPHDEDLFDYYAGSQLARVDAASGKIAPFGKPGIIESAQISPDGQDVLVTIVHRPFSYLHAVREFPKDIEVWDMNGKLLHQVASLPLE